MPAVAGGAASRGRVCHLTSVHRVNDVRIFHKECATLASAGFDVTLIGVAASAPDLGVRILTLPETGNRLTRMLGRARTAFRHALAARADIYHFHDPELLPYGFLLKQRTGARVVFDSHECFREDVVAKDWIPSVLRAPVGYVVGAIEGFVAGRIDQVIAATPHIAETFAGKSRRVVTINNYPLEDEFAAPPETASATTRNAVCYVGAISFVRGIIPFLDALSFVDAGVAVHVAGQFAGKPVEEAATSHPNWHRVTFHGQVNRDQIAEIYAASFAGVVTFLPAPNHVFSQPNKLFEYMSAGIPVICSDFTLWRSVVEEGDCGIAVDPSSPGAIGAAIMALRTDPARARQMAEHGLRLVRDRYNWTCEGRRLVETYDALLAS